jgi:tetratricopeptide (TPR) repeat protein
MIKRIPLTCLIVALVSGLCASARGDEATAPPLPTATAVPGAELLPTIEPSAMVQALIDDPLNDAQARIDLLIFHGRWDDLPDEAELTVNQRATLALLRYELDADVFGDAEVDVLLRAKAALERGEPGEAVTLLMQEDSAQAALFLSQGYEQLGRADQAVAVLAPWRDKLRRDEINDPAELTAAAQGLAALARLQGRPAQDYQLVLNLLGRVRQELDPAYWPALIAEADLLIEKDNSREGVDALTAALELNSRCAQAWSRLGRLAIKGYAFDRAAAVIQKLREINPTNPLADLIEARSLLQQRDVAGAQVIIESGLSRYPGHRELLALNAAAVALTYDEQATRDALQRFDQVSPGNPLAAYTTGTFLATARQYDQAEAMLREAVALAPNWATPRIELGLLLMQAAHDEEAQRELAAATRLDPFNKRAANQLAMLNDLLTYERIETEHFLIRYKPGIDEALARDMPDKLEAIYRDITAAFDHKPQRITRIDLMPDEQHFAVRITGMPEIWTIAAATGDAIAMTPPREGTGQRGGYDWPNVIRHEFVHTVTLDQTRNRVPHWFTEACAVSQETSGRSYDTCRLLAEAFQKEKLFPLDQINWGFIRPKTPADRPLAYAQSDWMLEYIAVRFGHRAIVEMLELYSQGVPDTDALTQVTGESAQAFMSGFKDWAANEVDRWGLAQTERSDRLVEVLTGRGKPTDEQELESLRSEHPHDPDLLRLLAMRAMDRPDTNAAQRAVLRYADSRPVDPWPHRALVELAIAQGQVSEAVGSLEYLDQSEPASGNWAVQLAKAYRQTGKYTQALSATERALDREPYNASYRELAAAIALQTSDTERALHHVYAAGVIEPDRAIHQVRLAALYQRLGRLDDADAAALKAIELDADAPVQKFLKVTGRKRPG